MAEPLKIVPTGLLPADQERETQIIELSQIVCDEVLPLHQRRDAWRQMQDLIAKRPEYVIKKMEREQGLL